ncbi:MAG TPA: hypothetical protein VFY83_01725, partial [Anaerolineales bacterium]|nr:hypothetical protein [Anaerolineales bacterium]
MLQTGEWGELKAAFGWKPVRIISGNVGAQILFRKLPLGLTVGYIPKLAIDAHQSVPIQELWREIDSACKQNHAIFLKLEPDLWQGSELDQLPIPNHREASLWDQFRISPQNIQPPRTIIVDVRNSEDEILARMKQKT